MRERGKLRWKKKKKKKRGGREIERENLRFKRKDKKIGNRGVWDKEGN